jgi:hypothetical protein
MVAGLVGVTLAADTPGPLPRPPGELVRPLGYSPGWLPPGVHEYRRQNYFPGLAPLERYWTRSTAREDFAPYLRMSVQPPRPGFDGSECLSMVDTLINGRPGCLSDGGDRPHTLSWLADADAIITLDNEDLLDRRSLLRLAGSIRPDQSWAAFPIQPPADLRHWPSVYLVNGAGARFGGTSPSNWEAAINPGDDPDRDENMLQIRLARTTKAPGGGRRLRLGGRPARYIEKSGPGTTELSQFVVVEVGHGWLLTVESWTIAATHRGQQRPAPSFQDMVGLAARTRVDLSRSGWIGKPG